MLIAALKGEMEPGLWCIASILIPYLLASLNFGTDRNGGNNSQEVAPHNGHQSTCLLRRDQKIGGQVIRSTHKHEYKNQNVKGDVENRR